MTSTHYTCFCLMRFLVKKRHTLCLGHDTPTKNKWVHPIVPELKFMLFSAHQILKKYIQLGEKKDWTKHDFRSKTTLIIGGVCRTCVNPPFCQMATFFHRSLALSMPIYRNFHSNGVKWRSIKLWKQKFHITGY